MAVPQFYVSTVGRSAVPAESGPVAVVTSAGLSQEYAVWGMADNLPDLLISLAEKSAILPGIFEFWEGVLIGKGLGLYEKVWDEQARKFVVHEVYDKQASPWLEDSGALEYLLAAMPDFLATGNAFAQGVMNIGSMNARQRIREFYHTEVIDCRLATMEKGHIPEVFVGSFGDRSIENIETVSAEKVGVAHYRRGRLSYPKGLCMFHVKRKKAGRRYYGMPVWFSKESEIILNSTTEMFELQRGNLKNEIRPKFHIKIFRDYFKDKFPEPEYNEDHRQREKEKLVQGVHDNLSKPENAGKALWSDFIIDPRTGDVKSGIMIEPIDAKYNSDAYLKSRDQAVAMLAMATNTNPGLADLIISGKLGSDTGSAVRESYNVLHHTKTFINRKLLLGPINEAIRFNWPNRRELFVDVKGFELTTTDEQKSGVKPVDPAEEQERKDAAEKNGQEPEETED